MFQVLDTKHDVVTSVHADWSRAGQEAKRRDAAAETRNRYLVTDEFDVPLSEPLRVAE